MSSFPCFYLLLIIINYHVLLSLSNLLNCESLMMLVVTVKPLKFVFHKKLCHLLVVSSSSVEWGEEFMFFFLFFFFTDCSLKTGENNSKSRFFSTDSQCSSNWNQFSIIFGEIPHPSLHSRLLFLIFCCNNLSSQPSYLMCIVWVKKLLSFQNCYMSLHLSQEWILFFVFDKIPRAEEILPLDSFFLQRRRRYCWFLYVIRKTPWSGEFRETSSFHSRTLRFPFKYLLRSLYCPGYFD